MTYASFNITDEAKKNVLTLREIYLSIFVVFYRVLGGLWPTEFNADAHKGSTGITFVECLLVFSLFDWMQISIGHRVEINPLIAGIAAATLYFTNNYFLVSRGSGIAFEKQFNHFGLRKRIALRLCGIAVVLAAILSIYVSTTAYRRAF